jgi:diaminohydroxyphosphoribosylaminopyrimidine deaminase/5-amino-6-(5-phosphoribosylamino)uracil reductase
VDHETYMREAMAEAEKARGHTGDNPWVGCVIVDAAGNIVSRGFTRGPGEDHAEIGALRAARGIGADLAGGTLYSTLEPCSFHGRTPACAKVVAECGVSKLVLGLRDPHPRVDGVGAKMVRDAGLTVVEGICEGEVLRQLAPWIFAHHPHEPTRRVRALLAEGHGSSELIQRLMAVYGVDRSEAERLVALERTAP